MRKLTWPVVTLGLLVWGSSQFGCAEGLRAGVAKVEITPDEPAYMAGYRSRKKPSEGVFDPLYARVLLLEHGNKRLAMISLDLCWFPSARVPREAKERFGVDLTLMAASHTHSGPDYLHAERWDDPAKCAALLHKTEDRVLEAIKKAKSDMFPARLSVARGNITLGYHRLVMQPAGRRKAFFRNFERIPVGPVDPTVAIIRIEDTDAGTTRAVIVNYACHPVCHSGRNYKFSADYPGPMAAKIEKSVPRAICLFTQGGCGSVNPLFLAERPDPPKDQERAKAMGELLADEVLRALPNARPVAGPDDIQWRARTQTFASRWSTTETLEIGTATVMLNRSIGIMAIPGEPFLAHQVAFKRDAPVEFPVFLGYTNSVHPGWPDYLPDIRSAAEGGYGADKTTKIDLGAGERLVNQAVIDLFDMKGMFFDTEAKR